MIRGLFIVLILALALIVQMALFGHVRPFGVIPNLVLVAMVAWAIWSEATVALGIAVIAGIMVDISSGADFGLRTAFFLVVTLAIISARQLGVHTDSLATGVIGVIIATLLLDLAILTSLTAPIVQAGFVVEKIAVESLLNAIIFCTIFAIQAVRGDHRSRVISELNRRSWL